MTFSSVLAIGLGALAVQVLYRPRPVYAGWRTRAAEQENNELGYRGHPIRYGPDDTVVVLLGDSQVEARACAYDWMPERRLEHHLHALGRPARVVSVGAGGYGQDQELLALREYLARYRADYVVLWLTELNDVWNNAFPTHWPRNGWVKPTFWVENGALCGPDLQMGEPVGDSSAAVLTLLARAFPSDRDGAWAARHLPEPYAPLVGYAGSLDHSWQAQWDRDAPIGQGEDLIREKSHYSIRLTPPSPRLRYGLELTRLLLREIERECEGHGARFALFRVPWPEYEDEPETVHELNGRHYKTSGAQMRANIADLTLGFTVHEVIATVPSPRVGPGDVHLNQHGVDQVMADLAARLAPGMTKK